MAPSGPCAVSEGPPEVERTFRAGRTVAKVLGQTVSLGLSYPHLPA